MPYATWQILIDTNGSYFGNVDITQWVKRFNYNAGFRQPYTFMAGENQATIVLDNTDKRFSPENPSGFFYNEFGLNLVIIKANGSPMWYGFWESIAPQWGENREHECVITATGPQRFLDRMDVKLPLLRDKYVNELMTTLQGQITLPRYRTDQWVLGATGFSELGVTTRVTFPLNINEYAGSKPIPYAGDTWGEKVNILTALQQIAQFDRGKMFIDASNTISFLGRIQLLQNQPTLATFDNTWHEADYAWGKNLANVVRISYKPRKVSVDNNETLWQADDTIELTPGESKTFTARYAEPDSDTRIAGEDFIIPTSANGNLVATPDTVGVVGFNASARGAEITLQNTGNRDATVTLLRLRGRKVSTFGSAEVVLRDANSIAQYGTHEYAETVDLCADEETALQIAGYELYRRKEPLGEFRSISFYNQNATILNHMLTLGTGAGSIVRLIENQTVHDAYYIIIGVEHSVSDAMRLHKATFYLERRLPIAFWQLGISGLSELGTSTVLSF